ncbi:MAG TPA: CSLREA domain-containing protein, partial [Anaerolineae bacterium]
MLSLVINQTLILTRLWRLYLAGLIALLALLSLPIPIVQAATITVNTTDDEFNTDGDCSLREAIIAANTDAVVDNCPAGSGADIIDLPAGTYVLTIGGNEDAALAGDLDLTADVTITGAGQTTTIINGNSLDPVFEIAANRNVQISDITVIGGDGSLDEGGGLTINGGGILNLINSTISGNSA